MQNSSLNLFTCFTCSECAFTTEYCHAVHLLAIFYWTDHCLPFLSMRMFTQFIVLILHNISSGMVITLSWNLICLFVCNQKHIRNLLVQVMKHSQTSSFTIEVPVVFFKLESMDPWVYFYIHGNVRTLQENGKIFISKNRIPYPESSW